VRAAEICLGLDEPPGDSGVSPEEVRIWLLIEPTFQSPERPPQPRWMIRFRPGPGGEVRAVTYEFIWEAWGPETLQRREDLWRREDSCTESHDCGPVLACRLDDIRNKGDDAVWRYLVSLQPWSLPDASDLPGFTSWEALRPGFAIQTVHDGVARLALHPWYLPDPVLAFRRAAEVALIGHEVEWDISFTRFRFYLKHRDHGRREQ